MNVKPLIFVFLCVAQSALAQGFAGLVQTPEGFALPDPDTRFEYPSEHGAHPMFRIEWWYFTANLSSEDGAVYGIQWTLFRNALSPNGADVDQAWMGHAAISAPEGHFYAERLARGGVGHAGARATPFEAFIDEWAAAGEALDTISLTAQGAEFRYDLSFNADRPFVPQGASGFSVKTEGGLASHYYSQPFYDVVGTLRLPSGDVKVSGQGWLDREWSSQPLEASQTGWDWVSLHLDGGQKLMGYRLRDEDGTAYTVGTWIDVDGTPAPFTPGDIEMSALDTALVAGRDVPVAWSVSVPEHGVDVRVEAVYPQSWMATSVPYWEGPVSVSGTHAGVGYLEMTGYE